MKAIKVAKRYARSLLDEVVQKDKLEEVKKDIDHILDCIHENRELRIVLKSPVIKTENKINVLSRVFEERVEKITLNFLKLVCQKGREHFLKEMAEQFIVNYREHKNILTAEVTTSVPMDGAIRGKVLKAVREEEGQEVVLDEKVDKDIIGGVILRVGDKQYDGSVAKQLRKLSRTL